MALQAAAQLRQSLAASVEAPFWRWLGLFTTILVLLATVVAFGLARRPDPSFASPYDGEDPNAAGCVDAAVTTPVGTDGPRITDLHGRQVGRIELKASPNSGTAWARIVLDEAMAPEFKGKLVVLTVYRPADDTRSNYPLRLQGGTVGFSNMLSVTDTCVQAEAHFIEMRGSARR